MIRNTSDSNSRSRTWLSGWFDGASDEERSFAAVLETLSGHVVDAELARIEADSTARRSMADIKEEQVEAEREHRERMRACLEPFRSALLDAHRRTSAGRPATFDSIDPVQNRQAEVLIQYLVRSGYADVTTDEPQPGRYVYTIDVHWQRLQSLAESLGLHLPF